MKDPCRHRELTIWVPTVDRRIELDSFLPEVPGYVGHIFDVGIRGERCFARFRDAEDARSAKVCIEGRFPTLMVSLSSPPRGERELCEGSIFQPAPEPRRQVMSLGEVAVIRRAKKRLAKAEDFDVALYRECLALLIVPL